MKNTQSIQTIKDNSLTLGTEKVKLRADGVISIILILCVTAIIITALVTKPEAIKKHARKFTNKFRRKKK